MFPPLAVVKKRLVDEAVVAKSVVVVAFVDVERRKVTFCRVDEPVTSRFVVVAMVATRFEKVFTPLNALLSARRVDEAIPEMTPQVTLPFTTFKALEVEQFPVAMKRFVVLAVVAKKFVEVLFVVVEFTAVKFCKVLDPVRSKLESVVSPAVAVRVPVKLAAEEMV